MSITLSLPEARRLAVSAQGFGARPATPSVAHLRKLAARLHALQIDSVNVVTRAHYVPAFARLGPYSTDALDSLTYKQRELFEYWGHAACLLPISLYPLVRYRMNHHAERTLAYMRTRRGAYMARIFNEVGERGPISAGELSNPRKRAGSWWGWMGSANGKAVLEHLYDAGLVTISGRRRFERLYDLTERVIPRAVLDVPALSREDAMKELIYRGAQACGVGTFGDITGYFYVGGWSDRVPPGPRWERPKSASARRAKPITRRLVSELVDEGRLLETRVDGWKETAYVDPRARVPGSIGTHALVTPFDSLVWDRRRVERLFGMKYTLELYVPAPKRRFGYYVFPFLLGDTLVARCDLKADRQRGVLMVQSAFLEPGQAARFVASELAGELGEMRSWLKLDRVEVANRGDLAPVLRQIAGNGRTRA